MAVAAPTMQAYKGITDDDDDDDDDDSIAISELDFECI
jgi:hypothetical protein